jgi:hypothetical protein
LGIIIIIFYFTVGILLSPEGGNEFPVLLVTLSLYLEQYTRSRSTSPASSTAARKETAETRQSGYANKYAHVHPAIHISLTIK